PTRSFNEPLGNSSLITIRDISFYSMCEHHLLPFFGKVEIVYAPENNRIAGFSDFARIVNVYSRRLQIQERMTEQIADAIVRLLQPKGVRVTVEALQLCAAMRGEHRNNVQTVTRCVRGSFHEDA
ncbi:MAG: GTP cyclohydrolase I FolE, partial [Calditrichaeota bacterium]